MIKRVQINTLTFDVEKLSKAQRMAEESAINFQPSSFSFEGEVGLTLHHKDIERISGIENNWKLEFNKDMGLQFKIKKSSRIKIADFFEWFKQYDSDVSIDSIIPDDTTQYKDFTPANLGLLEFESYELTIAPIDDKSYAAYIKLEKHIKNSRTGSLDTLFENLDEIRIICKTDEVEKSKCAMVAKMPKDKFNSVENHEYMSATCNTISLFFTIPCASEFINEHGALFQTSRVPFADLRILDWFDYIKYFLYSSTPSTNKVEVRDENDRLQEKTVQTTGEGIEAKTCYKYKTQDKYKIVLMCPYNEGSDQGSVEGARYYFPDLAVMKLKDWIPEMITDIQRVYTTSPAFDWMKSETKKVILDYVDVKKEADNTYTVSINFKSEEMEEAKRLRLIQDLQFPLLQEVKISCKMNPSSKTLTEFGFDIDVEAQFFDNNFKGKIQSQSGTTSDFLITLDIPNNEQLYTALRTISISSTNAEIDYSNKHYKKFMSRGIKVFEALSDVSLKDLKAEARLRGNSVIR